MRILENAKIIKKIQQEVVAVRKSQQNQKDKAHLVQKWEKKWIEGEAKKVDWPKILLLIKNQQSLSNLY